MFKVVMWDYTGESEACAKFYLKDDVKVIRTLRPDDPDQAEVIMRGDWNFVLIFEQGQRELFNEIFKTMREMKVSTENIVFAKDPKSVLDNPDVRHIFKLGTPIHDSIQRNCDFFNHRRWHHYTAVSAEGLHYVGTAADNVVMWWTNLLNKNFAADEMKLFHALAKKYYGINDSGGDIFLDLGANIGTTGLYFIKKFAPDMKLIAFEPDAENFKLLRVNTILNDMEDKATLVNCGLGDKFDEMTMYRSLSNPGENNVTAPKDNVLTETIKIIPLDAYLAENKIAAEEIKYIWIDTEGFEPQVLLGAKNLLRKNPAPIFMECNLRAWDKSGCFDDMLALLSEHYSYFIYVQGGETIYPLHALKTLQRPNNPFGQIGDIFLIKKGAID